jgi:hypothetical protein
MEDREKPPANMYKELANDWNHNASRKFRLLPLWNLKM